MRSRKSACAAGWRTIQDDLQSSNLLAYCIRRPPFGSDELLDHYSYLDDDDDYAELRREINDPEDPIFKLM